MAQNITLLGASYTAVPAVTLPKTGGGTATFSDPSITTAVESDVAEGKTFLLADGSIGIGTGSGGGGDEPVGPTYETIVPLQTINCTTALANGAYGGYISNYTEYTSEGQKYRVIFDGTEYTPLTAAYYGGTTNYLYIGDANVEASSSATLTYPFEVMLYGGQTFYLGVKGSGSHTLQVDKITSEGSGGESGGGGDTASNPLKGKIATFTGDSICQGAGYAGGYAKIIGEDYDMTVENIGVSDGTVVRWQNKFCISESIADMRSDADFVMLEGGGNDADWGPQYIPVGTLSSGYNATLDTTTFAGAFETMLKSAIARFPNAKIGYIFPHKCIANFDAPNGAYRNMAISALEKWGIPYCDLNVMVPPLGYIDDLKTAYTRGDGIHPNEAGYRTFYAPKIAAFMQTMLTDKSLINKTVTANGTYIASDDDADGYDSVTVNVAGGASNIVTGTFKGTTTGAAMDVNLNYSGTGYPIAVLIFPEEGTANPNGDYYPTLLRGAIMFYSVIKNVSTTAPTYTGGTNDDTTYACRYKSSTTNASTTATGGGVTTTKLYDDTAAASGNTSLVKIRSNKKLSVYILSSSGSSNGGFMANIDYRYIVYYSS